MQAQPGGVKFLCRRRAGFHFARYSAIVSPKFCKLLQIQPWIRLMVACTMARYHARCVRAVSRHYKEFFRFPGTPMRRSRRRRPQGDVGGREVKTTDASVIDRRGVAGRRTIKATNPIRPAQDTNDAERLRQRC